MPSLLAFFLTCIGMVDFALPRSIGTTRGGHKPIRQTLKCQLHAGRLRLSFRYQPMFQRLRGKFCKIPVSFLDLPYEIRERVYQLVCTPMEDGSVPGAMHLLQINKQIYAEALPIFNHIPHVIVIGDTKLPEDDSTIWGMPRHVEGDWHHTIRRLILVVSVYSIGTMTPDTFDVNISVNGKAQWRNLKRLVGIWPETREQPLEEIRLDVLTSERGDCIGNTYRVDLIRIIRNFKRTRVWAESGDCRTRNTSMLLPLVRAFNQARRNWVAESTAENNLLIKFDRQVLVRGKGKEKRNKRQRKQWSILPTDDTSRSDNQETSEWTEKEERYVAEKMIQPEQVPKWECKRCLATFDVRRQLKEHIARGRD